MNNYSSIASSLDKPRQESQYSTVNLITSRKDILDVKVPHGMSAKARGSLFAAAHGSARTSTRVVMTGRRGEKDISCPRDSWEASATIDAKEEEVKPRREIDPMCQGCECYLIPSTGFPSALDTLDTRGEWCIGKASGSEIESSKKAVPACTSERWKYKGDGFRL